LRLTILLYKVTSQMPIATAPAITIQNKEFPLMLFLPEFYLIYTIIDNIVAILKTIITGMTNETMAMSL
jgi:hypothetical protein